MQIDVSVNAPESGTIKEFLAKEEDTVAVDQELVRLELGGAPAAKEEQTAEKQKEPAEEKPKEPSAEKQKEPSAEKPKEPSAERPKEPSAGQEKAPEPSKATPQPPSQPEAPKQKPASDSKPAVGSREERRVRAPQPDLGVCHNINSLLLIGENESDATEDRGAPEAVSEHSCLPHDVQRG